ncbi:MAG: hypothetical protein U0841_18315 [Chloroflexia bacterium]
MTTLRKRMIALVGGLSMALLLAVAAVSASGASAANTATGTDFLSKLAANLGIGQDQLTSAVKQTNLQLIDEAVAAGTMTADQAQAARDRVNNSTDGGGFGVRLGGGKGGERGGFGGGKLDEATATYFGITTDQLHQDLASAGSLQGVAAKYGKDTDAGKAGLKTALETALRQQLTDQGVDTATIDQRVAAFDQNFDQYYTQTRGDHGPRSPQTPGASPSASPSSN